MVTIPAAMPRMPIECEGPFWQGVYQHRDEKRLQHYPNEFDFRYSNRAAIGCTDGECATRALKGIEESVSLVGGLTAGPRPLR